jgi:exodeoxyribonuclease VII large subunit
MDILSQLTEDRPRRMTVTELTAQIRRRLEGDFSSIYVEGEISNFIAHSSGHWYFTLKDGGAQVRCACWRGSNLRIRFRPQNGAAVICRGKISVYAPKGEYQLVVEGIEPVGIGAEQLAFEQLKERLAFEGLFDPVRKRPLPLLPERIGVVTSPTGAAIRDILRVLHRRNESLSVLLYPARVEGDGAGEEVAAGIHYLSDHHGPDSAYPLDALIVGRGGGSSESLRAFNDEGVARAIFASKIPVISAVGHEIDFTIADFVADVRASTPSVAAEMVSARRDEITEYVRGVGSQLLQHVQLKILEARHHLNELERDPVFDDVRARLRDAVQTTDELTQRLEDAIESRLRDWKERERAATVALERRDWTRRLALNRRDVSDLERRMETALQNASNARSERLERAIAQLDALSPLRVLARGYALVRDDTGRIIRRAADLAPGDEVNVRVADGEFRSRVLPNESRDQGSGIGNQESSGSPVQGV